MSPKRKEDGEEVYHSKQTLKSRSTKKTIIVELADLEKEYLIVLAKLKLIQHGKTNINLIANNTEPGEIISLLSKTGLFDIAFSVADKLGAPKQSIFESLATKCVQLLKTRNIDILRVDAWQWLNLNEATNLLPVTAKSAASQSLCLLQAYIEKFSKPNSSAYYKTVATRFLYSGCPLPAWVVVEYKKRNAAELLRLYLSLDKITDATNLAVEYIDAVLGVQKDAFGLGTALHASTPPVWLPYSSIDQLLLVLRNNFDNSDCQTMCEHLQTKLDVYLNLAETTSMDKLQLARPHDNMVLAT